MRITLANKHWQFYFYNFKIFFYPKKYIILITKIFPIFLLPLSISTDLCIMKTSIRVWSILSQIRYFQFPLLPSFSSALSNNLHINPNFSFSQFFLNIFPNYLSLKLSFYTPIGSWTIFSYHSRNELIL